MRAGHAAGMTDAPAPPSPSPARTRPAGGALARALLILAVLFLPLGLSLPVLETTQFWVFKSTYSLIDTVRALIEEDEPVLAGLITLFSFVTPALKAAAATVLHVRRAGSAAGPLARWVERLGKWSLTDVLVVALLIVLASQTGLELASNPGLWFFAASGILLMIASELIVRDLEAGRGQ